MNRNVGNKRSISKSSASNAPQTHTHGILAKVPILYNHLKHQPGAHTQPLSNPQPRPQRYFPDLKSPHRIQLAFSSSPFPHMEKVVIDPIPDKQLEKEQTHSKRRREAYPQMGKAKLRQGDIPDILDPNFPAYAAEVDKAFDLLMQNKAIKSTLLSDSPKSPSGSMAEPPKTRRTAGQVALPLPSMLHKPIGKEEYVEKINSFKAKQNIIKQKQDSSSTRHSIHSLQDFALEQTTPEDQVFFQHVLQPDFSDFEQNLMIQKPMVIYLQQKPIRNPLRYYR